MRVLPLVLATLAASSALGQAEKPAQAASAFVTMPVKEVTVFKDGHAFVVHEGRMPVDPTGYVVLDRLPAPILGTFWPYSAQRGVELTNVTASRRRQPAERTATDVRGLLAANPGATVDLVDVEGKSVSGRLRELPSLPVEERIEEGAAGENLVPAPGFVVLLETADGVLAMPVDRVRSVTFRESPAPRYASEGYRQLLTLGFAWPGGRREREIDVGMAYVQKGLRWLPSYRVTIDGAGHAHVELQATLVNELVDLEDVTVNLVIGVPTFVFKETVDPMALQATVARLGPYFDSGSASGYALSNAIMYQAANVAERQRDLASLPTAGPGPEISGSEKEEDLFVFTVKGVTLKKGERMVLPVTAGNLGYRDVFVLDLPFAPPTEMRPNVGDAQQRELARLLAAPRFMHVLRLANTLPQPLTTAPALISSGDRVLGQGMISYTASGDTCDLALTTAVDVKATKRDQEVRRVPNAVTVNGSPFLRVDLEGKIAITNRRPQAVEVEVTRAILGHADTVGQGGKAAMLSADDDSGFVTQPPWWGWYGWPGWWGAMNGFGRFTWKARIDPGQSMDLTYAWHYFWQ